MDFMTIFGLLGALALLVWSILLGGSLILFYDFPSVVMVIGGASCVTVMSYRPSDLKAFLKVAMRSMLFKLPTPQQEIERIITYANLARKEGLLALELWERQTDALLKVRPMSCESPCAAAQPVAAAGGQEPHDGRRAQAPHRKPGTQRLRDVRVC